jgi:hypothetical protein
MARGHSPGIESTCWTFSVATCDSFGTAAAFAHELSRLSYLSGGAMSSLVGRTVAGCLLSGLLVSVGTAFVVADDSAADVTRARNCS